MTLRRAVDSGVAMVALALTGLLVGAVAWVLGSSTASDLAWAMSPTDNSGQSMSAFMMRSRVGSPSNAKRCAASSTRSALIVMP